MNALLQKIADRVLTSIPADAKWVHIAYINPDGRPGAKPVKTYGWLLKTDNENYSILDCHGGESLWPKKDTTLTPSTLASAAAELVTIRKRGSEGVMSLSAQGSLSGQFEPGFITAPEALVGAWSFVRGDKATAAAVLFPCLDAATDQRWIDRVTCDLLANPYHQRMLEKFSLERDYASTLRYAQHLSKPIFDEFNYQDRAKELTAQLPKRMDDFKTFTLPKPDEWTKQKAGMKREDQISFLAAHLRLLNCIQQSQPGGISYADPQHAETFDALRKAAMKARSWDVGTVVINPYNELKAMALSPADIQLLLPYVIDDDFLPTFSYWRSFHPGRTLHRVSWAVATLINDASQQTLVDLGSLEGMSTINRKTALDKIKAWCSAHEGKSSDDLLAETIRTTKNPRDFLKATQEALKANLPQLVTLAASRADEFPKLASDIAEICLKSGAPGFVDRARQWIKANPRPKPFVAGETTVEESGSAFGATETRFWSALILLRDGNRTKSEGLDVLVPILNEDDGSYFDPRAIPTLLASKDEKLMALADGVLKKTSLLSEPWDEGDQIKRLFLAGRPECRDFLIATLKDVSPDGQSTMDKQINGKSVTEPILKGRFIAEIVSHWRTENDNIDENLPNSEQIKKREELANWLNAQFDLIAGGKPSNMNTRLSSEIPEAHVDAP